MYENKRKIDFCLSSSSLTSSLDDEHVLAMDLALDGVRHCLHLCGITAFNVQDAVMAKGFIDIMSFAELRDKDIHEMVKTINATPIVAPPVAIADGPIILPPEIPPVLAGHGRGRGRRRGRGEQPNPPIVPPLQVPPLALKVAMGHPALPNYSIRIRISPVVNKSNS
jgi:hypothetical protein